jgi:hypothetical protein
VDTSWLTDGNDLVEGHVELTARTLAAFSAVYNTIQPSKVTEIGFNAGHSAMMVLELLPDVQLNSIDPCRYQYTRVNAIRMFERYGDRFRFTPKSSFNIDILEYNDLVFVDGQHSPGAVMSDLGLCMDSNAKYILVDDYMSAEDTEVSIHMDKVIDDIVDADEFPYSRVSIINYDCSGGESCALLLKRD